MPIEDSCAAAPPGPAQTSIPLGCLHLPVDNSAKPDTVMPDRMLSPLLTGATPALCRRLSYLYQALLSLGHLMGDGMSPEPLCPDFLPLGISLPSPGPIPDSETAGPEASLGCSPSSGPEKRCQSSGWTFLHTITQAAQWIVQRRKFQTYLSSSFCHLYR